MFVNHIHSFLESIDNYAFEYCPLTTIDIPSTMDTNITSPLGSSSFWGCPIETFIIRMISPPMYIGSIRYDGFDKINFYVPDTSLESYKNATGYGEFGYYVSSDNIFPISQLP